MSKRHKVNLSPLAKNPQYAIMVRVADEDFSKLFNTERVRKL